VIDLKEIADNMSQNDIIFTFQGELHEQTISDLLDFTEHRMQEHHVDRSKRKKVFMVLMESLQNSFKHGSPKMEDSSTVALLQHTDCFELIIGNYLSSKNRKPLEEKLKMIERLSHDEMRSKYREILNNGEQSDVGGSGLGLLHIARRTGKEINYNIEEVSKELCYLTLNIKIE
jgi:hypothetical protein